MAKPDLAQKYWWLLPLLAAVFFSLYTHAMVWSEFVAPTFGNTGIHVASARHFVEKGFYPLEDYSYGGNIPNLYVPIYRAGVAELVWLTALDFDFINRLIVTIFAILVPLGLFALGRKLFGTTAGLFAAFLASLPAELLIYTVRPLPQAMGLALLPLALLMLYQGRRVPAIAASFAIVLVHQEAALFFVACAFAYGVAGVAMNTLQKAKVDDRFVLALACWLVGAVTYLAWHFAMTGSIAFWELAQFKHHEGNVLDAKFFMEKTGEVLAVLGIFGAIAAGISFAVTKKRQELFALCLLVVGVVLVKNDLVGLRVFMDRFLVYLQLPMIVVAGLGAAKLVELAEGAGDWVENTAAGFLKLKRQKR